MVIPAPIEVDGVMRTVKRGKVATINDHRKALAEKHEVDIGCPITTGIFAWIAAHAAAAPAAPAPPDAVLPHANAFAARFFERVAMADKLYVEEDVRGSLTDRGGALILLGPPPVMRVLRRKVPALDASRPGRTGEVLEVPVEIWAYRPADLPELARLEPKLGEAHEITLTFRAGGPHVTLLDGRSILRLAARAAVEHP